MRNRKTHSTDLPTLEQLSVEIFCELTDAESALVVGGVETGTRTKTFDPQVSDPDYIYDA